MKKGERETVSVVLAGNPNVGKSTVFNALTGMRQHTGNWTGKTVETARGTYLFEGERYELIDSPGAYSLTADSPDEEAARDAVCFGGADTAVVVCDAACLERGLNLVFQTLEVTGRCVVCVNLMDEAEKRGIKVDINLLSEALGVPVVGAAARSGKGLSQLMAAVKKAAFMDATPKSVRYSPAAEDALSVICPAVGKYCVGKLPARWLALRLLIGDEGAVSAAEKFLGAKISDDPAIASAIEQAEWLLEDAGETFSVKEVSAALYEKAAETVKKCVERRETERDRRQLFLDRLPTRRAFALPIMLLLLSIVFYLTVRGANYPTALLEKGFEVLGRWLYETLAFLPEIVRQALVNGVYGTLSAVVAVMLPPMAIFFPLFTLLEDLGYLPRAAFCLDSLFRKSGACGKQALTMCMGLGCNAAGVTGCRIIGSEREKLTAVLTNTFVPCNGRFPTLLALPGIFMAAGNLTPGVSALCLTAAVGVSFLLTLSASRLLTATALKGENSSFILELPPFRAPQAGKVIVRSVFDRTLFVLGRAAAVAAPAGLVIFLAANVKIGGESALSHVTGFLDPFARLFGLDGVILAAFIFGIPANETVLPIAVMAYTASGVLGGGGDLGQVLIKAGWTPVTAVCVMLFTLLHWPCATTLWTIYRETGSLK
ncbi:MAG: ferrous iron transport protein B, partial [Oscillospiraceae bacterium]|nr:ferrous iron transport protein B [Oscillospiraceae bacterium]